MTAPVAGGGVDVLRTMDRAAYLQWEDGYNADAEDMEAARTAVAELIAAADCFSAAMAEDSSYLRDILDGIRPLERGSFVESLKRLRAALSNIERAGQ